ncbi:MAG: hypothetical protein IPG09_12485 [Ignavibacteria bacterium]|nr:hypothetical protein [Ignavibacteria bacterium]
MERQWEIQAIRSINGTAMGNSSYPFHKWNGNEKLSIRSINGTAMGNSSFPFHKWNGNGKFKLSVP